MTLRCTIEIVPFGDEERKRTIGVLNISNIGRIGWDDYAYEAKLEELERPRSIDPVTFEHARADGAWRCVQRALEAIEGALLRKRGQL